MPVFSWDRGWRKTQDPELEKALEEAAKDDIDTDVVETPGPGVKELVLPYSLHLPEGFEPLPPGTYVEDD